MINKFGWFRYDLHMHSQFSSATDGSRVKIMTAKDFINNIKSQVDVFSITDHNKYSSSYYHEIRKFINEEELNLGVIDGVELNVYINEKDFFHMGLYFQPNNIGSKIEKTIDELYTNNKPRLSQIIKKISELELRFILIPEGNKNRGIVKLLGEMSKNLYGQITQSAMYKVFSAFDVKSNFEDKSQNIWASNYFKNSKKYNDMIENLKEQELNKLRHDLNDKINNVEKKYEAKVLELYDYILNYSNYFAYFSFSDWHNAEKYEIEKYNFIYSSLDNCFESLEVAVLDPNSRIIRERSSKIEIPNNILKSISFDLNGVNKEIKFTPGLNVIIGKRGSGKSLLFNIIYELNKSSNDNLKKYQSKYNINNITGKDYGGIEITSGSLSSIAILSQSDIEKIYENPDDAWESISKKFPQIEKLEIKTLKLIEKYLGEIKPFEKDLKSITSNLIQLKKFNSYEFKAYKEINTIEINNSYELLSSNLNQLIENFKAIGLDTNDLIMNEKSIKDFYEKNILKIDKINKVISSNNLLIVKINKNQSEGIILNQKQKTEIEKSVSIIKNNFKKLMKYKKLEYLFNMFQIKNIPIEKNIFGKYLFMSSYKIPENLNDELLSKASLNLKRGKGTLGDLERIKKYLFGELELLSDKKLVSEFSKYINGDIFESRKEFFQINSDINVDTIKSNLDINDLVKNGILTDLNNESLGTKSTAYLSMLFNSDETILQVDQPEDNIDNDYISQNLVNLIKTNKRQKQLIFVTHNPSVAVYGDAFNFIYANNNNQNEINYESFFIENFNDKERILNILDGGKPSFSNRNNKYGNIIGEQNYENNNKKD